MSRPEDKLCNEIMATYGAEPGTIILRNIVSYGHPLHQPKRVVLYGLGEGSPDLVVFHRGLIGGCELKVPGKDLEPHQRAVHRAWELGADVHMGVGHTVDEFGKWLHGLKAKAGRVAA